MRSEWLERRCGSCVSQTHDARQRTAARGWDDAMSRERHAFDWNAQLELAVAPEAACTMHHEPLPQEVFKSAEFCSMCEPAFCSMHMETEMRRLARQLLDAGALNLETLESPPAEAPRKATFGIASR